MKTRYYVLIAIAVLVLAALAVLALYLFTEYGAACPRKATSEFLDRYNSLIERFADAFARAGSTSRIALSPVVGELQAIRREVNDLDDVCEEATELKAATVYAMDATIDAFMLFMANTPDDKVTAKFAEANRWMDIATRKVGVLAEAAGR